MLSAASAEHDARVRKEAETLAAAGYDVRVISVVSNASPLLETVRDVDYERVAWRHTTSDAWRRRKARQERRLKKVKRRLARVVVRRPGHLRVGGSATRAARRATTAVSLARRIYRAKNDLERKAYKHVRTAAQPVEIAASLGDALARFEPDVVHAHDLLTLYAGRRFACSRRIPLVYDAHELELESRRSRTHYDRLVARAFETLGIRAASAVITVAPEIAAVMADTYSIHTPVVLLNSPRLAARRAEPPLSLRDACRVGPEEKLVVYTGLITSGRGLEQTAAAFARLPAEHHFAVMGPRKAIREAEFLAQLGALGVVDRVHLIDPVPPRLVSATIATADAAVIPLMNVCRSYDLALPNKLFEAVMAGLPIAASSLRGVGGFVREHELGAVFDVDDTASIAQALVDVTERTPPGIADHARLERLQEGVAWEQQERGLLDLYRGLVRGDDLAHGA
jgi:glycogen(starch) synthase